MEDFDFPWDEMRAYVYRFLYLDPDSREEAVQQAAMRVWLYERKGLTQGQRRKWLFTIARNVAFDLLTLGKRRADCHLRAIPLPNEVADTPPDEGDPRAHVMRCCVDLLKPRMRLVVHLHYYQDVPLKEIARRLGIKASCARAIAAAARRKLRKLYRLHAA